MKKQINPTTKAHLIRGAFYLLLLIAVCAIPFALAQRNSKPSKQITPPRALQKPDWVAKRPDVHLGHATQANGSGLRPYDSRPNPNADSAVNHLQSQPAGQAQSRPVLPPHTEGIDCDNAPGIVIHDDGGIENGYSGAPGLVTEVRFADKFTPSSYPASYTSVCLDFVIVSGGPPTYPVDVVVYDDDGPGGSPGTLLGELNGQTAVTHFFTGGGQAPVWNSYDISSMGLNITSGSVYIGARWVPPSNNVYLSADESGPVGHAGGYWWNNFDGVWSQTQNAFPGYTSMFIRAVESGGGGTPTPTPSGTPSCHRTHFNNSTPITIPDSGPASPYPSDIVVAGLTTLQKVTVEIKGLTHTFPADLDFLLVGPQGQNAIIWSDAGGGDDVTNITVTLDDDAAIPLPETGPIVSGRYQPANYGSGDTWPAPAPVPSGNVALSTFIGTDPNGTWSLYLVDDAALDMGEISGGWELIVYTDCAGGSPTPTASPSCTPIVVNGSIDTGDPTQTDRLFRSGVPQTCPPSTTCAIFGDPTPHHYDSYTFTNTTGATQCVHIDTNTACTGTNFIFTGAYQGSFDPNNICTNWIGDSGSSPNPEQAFDVEVPDGETLVVVVSEVTPSAGCPGYTVTITGLCGGGGVSPTPTATATATPTGSPSCPPEITQSTSNVIEQGDSVSCNNGFESTENHYWRAFNMNDFTGGLAYIVTSLDMGIETATSGGITLNSITVNIYANHGSPFPGGDWQSNLLGTSGPIDIPDQNLTFPVNIPIAANVAAGTLELVLEVVTADGQGLGNIIFIGANSAPETGVSYISAADCGITVPTPVGDVGFPNSHWVFFVNGGCGGTPTPTATATAVVSATPTATATATASGTPTATATATASHTPRGLPTPRPLPTRYPHPTPKPRPSP